MVKAGILDVSIGNILAVAGVLRRLGVDPIFVREELDLKVVTHLILPGVGNMGTFMSRLRAKRLDKGLCSYVGDGKLFGICLGFQALFEYSHEGECDCLGILDGEILPISVLGGDSTHVGHRKIEAAHPLITDEVLCSIRSDQHYYFTHSYYKDESEYCSHFVRFKHAKFTAVVGNGYNVYGTQFHPELSGLAGRQVIKSFLGYDKIKQ